MSRTTQTAQGLRSLRLQVAQATATLRQGRAHDDLERAMVRGGARAAARPETPGHLGKEARGDISLPVAHGALLEARPKGSIGELHKKMCSGDGSPANNYIYNMCLGLPVMLHAIECGQHPVNGA